MSKIATSIFCGIILVLSLITNSHGQSGQVSKSSWVKLCGNNTTNALPWTTVGLSKQTINSNNICLTHHERLDGNAGLVLVAVAIRKVPGINKERLMFVVPLGMAIPLGIQLKIDNNTPHKLPYSICLPEGCVAEMDLTSELLNEMKAGNRMIVAVISRLGKPIGFPVPLNGISAAYAGPPMNSITYFNARADLLKRIKRKRASGLRRKF